jgi:hypothetical protein
MSVGFAVDVAVVGVAAVPGWGVVGSAGAGSLPEQAARAKRQPTMSTTKGPLRADKIRRMPQT